MKSIKSITRRKKTCITCNTCNTCNTFCRGVSLIEILVVVGIFAILGVLTTRAILLTVGGGKKTETVIKVRENLNYTLGVIERQLRNADSITDCTNSNTLQISYLDQNGNPSSFSCGNIGASVIGYVASGSARLTGDTIDITNCSFTCTNATSINPRSVKINLQAKDSELTGASDAIISSSTEIFLRNY